MRLDSYKVVFWDFDGVIKESVEVKADAFVKLFENYGSAITTKIRKHHLANGGMSRFEKLPIYYRWVEQEVSDAQIQKSAQRFSCLVQRAVINSPWVPGVERYLRENPYGQIFILISATPQEEMMAILKILNLHSCFKYVFGSPLSKSEAISGSLMGLEIKESACVVIGDAKTDLEAARVCNIDFLLRKHATNLSAFSAYKGRYIVNFLDL